MKPILVMAVASMLGLSGCSLARWEGFVYPNKKDPKAHLNIGRYWSYDGCREAAIETLNKKGAVQIRPSYLGVQSVQVAAAGMQYPVNGDEFATIFCLRWEYQSLLKFCTKLKIPNITCIA